MKKVNKPAYKDFGINKVKTVVMHIPLDQLRPGPWQQRKYFDEPKILELADSMKAAGTNVVPAIVTPDETKGGYNIIAGERRWRAAQRNGADTLHCLVGVYDYEQAAFICAVENLQRADLNPIEEAASYQALQDQLQFSHEDIAQKIGKSRPHVTNYLRLLKLDIQVRDALAKGTLSYAQARPLCALEFPMQQRKIALRAVKESWSVVRINREVILLTKKPVERVHHTNTDADLRRLEQTISENTGVPCMVRKKPDGVWHVGFVATDTEVFNGLLKILGVEIDSEMEI